jgi:hypothetical protein
VLALLFIYIFFGREGELWNLNFRPVQTRSWNFGLLPQIPSSSSRPKNNKTKLTRQFVHLSKKNLEFWTSACQCFCACFFVCVPHKN